MTTFDKDSSSLVFDLYVVVDLTLNLKLKGPDDAADDSFGGKLNRTITAGILNGPQNCPEYMSKAREGASQLLSNLSPRTPFGMRVRRAMANRREAIPISCYEFYESK